MSEESTTLVRKKSSFASDVLKLVSGSTISQVLTILAAPLLTRLYGPAPWGILALFTAITGILGVIVCLRYELAIMLPEKDEEAANLLGVSLIFPVIVSLLLVPVIWWGKEPVMRWLNAQELAPYLWLIPIMVFISGVFLALNYWNSRTRHFGRLAIARVTSSFATISGKLGFGYAGYANAGTMMYATVAGQAIATTILGGQIWRDDRKVFLKSISWKGMRDAIIRYRKFPIYSTWASLLNVISVQLPTMMLAFFFSPIVVGLYALGHRILTRPLQFIGQAVGQVFFQRAATSATDGTLRQVVEKTACLLAKIGFFPMILIAVIGPDLFSFVFGEQWREAGVYTQILVPWSMCVFISSPLSSLNSVLEKQRVGLLFNVLQISTRLGSLVIGGITGNIIFGLILFSLSGVFTVICFQAYHFKICGVNLRSFYIGILGILGIAIIFVSPVIFLKFIISAPIIPLLISSVFLTIGYYIFVILRDKDLLKMSKGILKRKL